MHSLGAGIEAVSRYLESRSCLEQIVSLRRRIQHLTLSAGLLALIPQSHCQASGRSDARIASSKPVCNLVAAPSGSTCRVDKALQASGACARARAEVCTRQAQTTSASAVVHGVKHVLVVCFVGASSDHPRLMRCGCRSPAGHADLTSRKSARIHARPRYMLASHIWIKSSLTARCQDCSGCDRAQLLRLAVDLRTSSPPACAHHTAQTELTLGTTMSANCSTLRRGHVTAVARKAPNKGQFQKTTQPHVSLAAGEGVAGDAHSGPTMMIPVK